MSRPLTEASEALLTREMEDRFQSIVDDGFTDWLSEDDFRTALARVEAEARAPLEAVRVAALAREAAEEALAEHMDRDAYNLTIPDWKASERERDRLTADRALAGAELRSALEVMG